MQGNSKPAPDVILVRRNRASINKASDRRARSRKDGWNGYAQQWAQWRRDMPHRSAQDGLADDYSQLSEQLANMRSLP